MIATLILTVSFVTLLQFFVSYSHSLIAESRRYELSERAREILGLPRRQAGVTALTVRGDDFKRLLQLIAVCPTSGGDNTRVRAVRAYFNLLGASRAAFGWIRPATAQWIESERGGCAYVMAVALDRRIANSQALMAQQAGM